MTVMIMIDSSIKTNRMLGFELQSLHVIERRYNPLIKKVKILAKMLDINILI